MGLAGSTRARIARGAAPGPGEKFLFVVAAQGGASIIDSFLPVSESDVGDPAAAQGLIAYPDSVLVQPNGSQLRCPGELFLDGQFSSDYAMSTFLGKYYADMTVVTVENTSVNHQVAQKRSITGAGIHRGRTLMEEVALQRGMGKLLPNCNMATAGFIEPGDDASVPDAVRSEVIADPLLFALAADGLRGVDGAPQRSILERARATREALEDATPQAERWANSRLRQRILALRRELQPAIEEADLITKLMLLQAGGGVDLSSRGLASSPELPALLEQFPELATDRLQAQAALAFLLVRYGLSSVVTFGPSFMPDFSSTGIDGTPIAFDFSHNDHVTTQNVMWRRTLKVVDGLITLLQRQPHGDGTLWDRSLIYVATDFGRTKTRPPGSGAYFGSGHDLNNGNLFISPLLRGNRVFGGVDPQTCLTYGFDLATGAPNRGAVMREGHLYSLVCHALGIDFPGRYDMSALLR